MASAMFVVIRKALRWIVMFSFVGSSPTLDDFTKDEYYGCLGSVHLDDERDASGRIRLHEPCGVSESIRSI